MNTTRKNKLIRVFAPIQIFLNQASDNEVQDIIVYDEDTVEILYKNGYMKDIDVSELDGLGLVTKVMNCI